MRIQRATIVTFVILAVSIGLAIILKNGAVGEANAESAVAEAPVRVIAIRPRVVVGEITVGGFLRARADITISAERAGRLVKLNIGSILFLEVLEALDRFERQGRSALVLELQGALAIVFAVRLALINIQRHGLVRACFTIILDVLHEVLEIRIFLGALRVLDSQ